MEAVGRLRCEADGFLPLLQYYTIFLWETSGLGKMFYYSSGLEGRLLRQRSYPSFRGCAIRWIRFQRRYMGYAEVLL
jgi:hypothetical protein